jgi:hypothetical protein
MQNENVVAGTADQIIPWAAALAAKAQAEAIETAEGIGTDKGRAAGTWALGNNVDRAAAAAVLKGIQEGDPMVMDAYAAPNLTGEWADEYGPADLAEDIGHAEGTPIFDAAATAYEDAAQTAFWLQLETDAANAAE